MLYLILFVFILSAIIIFLRLRKRGFSSFVLPKTSSFENIVLAIRVPKEEGREAESVAQKAPLLAEQMFSSLHGLLKVTPEAQEHISFEIASSKNGIWFYTVVPKSVVIFVQSQIYAQYPTAEIRQIDDYIKESEKEGQVLSAAYLFPVKPQFYPIRTFRDFEVDPLAAITSALTEVGGDDTINLQVSTRPLPDVWQKEGYEYAESIRAGKTKVSFGLFGILDDIIKDFSNLPIYIIKNFFSPGSLAEEARNQLKFSSSPSRLSAGQELELKAIENKLSKMGFETVIRVLVTTNDKEHSEARLRAVVGSFKQYATANLNSFKASFPQDNKDFLDDYKKRVFDENYSFVLTTEELASIFHLPSVSVETPAIAWTAAKKGEPPLNLPTKDCTLFASTTFRDALIPFGIKKDDRARHLYLIGKSGTGKTTLLKNMIIQDMRDGRGVAVLDPHGSLVEPLLDFVPDERIKDVIYFNPSDLERPLSFNMLECSDPGQKNLMASGLLDVFKKHFGEISWGPRLEYLLNNSILTLLEVPRTTLLGLTRLLIDTNYQKYIVYQIKDPVLKNFWETEYKEMRTNPRLSTEAVQPIQNKVGRFLASSTIRNIVGRARSTIKIDEIMNTGKILLVNLSKGKIGEDNANLLGSMLVTRFHFTAMQREKIPEKERKPFYLYVDEFQNVASGSFASILSEARKYNLCLNLTHQYINQLPEAMRDAVFGNVGTMVAYAVGTFDAKILADEFAPVFSENDLISLERYHLYVKLMIDGMTSTPFSAKALAPYEDKNNNRERVIAFSRENYGSPVEEVEQKINAWVNRQFNLGMAIQESRRQRDESKNQQEESGEGERQIGSQKHENTRPAVYKSISDSDKNKIKRSNYTPQIHLEDKTAGLKTQNQKSLPKEGEIRGEIMLE